MSMESDDKQILLMLSWLFLRHGQGMKAEPLCKAIQESEPGEPVSSLILASLCLEDARAEEALRYLGVDMARYPARIRRAVVLLRGRCLAALGREDEAQAVWRAYLAEASKG